MKPILILLFIFAYITGVMAQTRIEGTIEDQSREALPGANIFLKDSYDGATSCADGSFSFSTDETGEKEVIVRFVGYREQAISVLLTGETLQLRVTLEEEINELDAVTISAGSFTAGEQSRRTIFRAVDIATTAGATADIAGALNTLPGTQKVGESGRLFVRGGDGSETRTFIDGMLVLDAYSPSAPNAPSRGRFLPFMFKGTSFSTGGYSAEFGQALSSALVLDSKDESEVTRTDIGLLSVGADIAHTQAWSSGSVAAKLQYTNIRPYFGLINQEIDWKTPPASIEGVGAFRQKVGEAGMLKLYGNFSETDFSLYQHDIDDPSLKSYYRLQNHYHYLNASYKTILRSDWTMRSGISWSSIRNDSHTDQFNIDETEQSVHAKAVVEGSITKKLELKTGAEIISRNYEEGIAAMPVNSFGEVISSLFAEADFYASNRFVTRIGGRAEHNSLTGKASMDPRLSLAYKADGGAQLSFAYGKFRQTPLNKFVKVSPKLANERATHYILNFQKIRNDRTFRVEGYFKQYDDLVKYSGDGTITSEGKGVAKGVEFFWRDNRSLKGIDYWVSYSLLDTRRDYLDFPYESVPVFASRHNFSLVAKYFVSALKTQFGATYSFASGRPYNNPNEDTFNGGRTPSYQDLSVNISYLPKPHLIVHVSCTNVPGFDNVFGYEYSPTQDPSGVYKGRAIRQPAPRFLFVGVFITLSKSKSFNQLPSL